MQVVIDLGDPKHERGSRPMLIIEQRYLWLLALAMVAVVAGAIYWAARGIAAGWVASNDPIIAEVVRAEHARDRANRQRLWEDSVRRLQTEIAASHARLSELQQRGRAIADYLGLPGESMFAAATNSDSSGSDALQCSAIGNGGNGAVPVENATAETATAPPPDPENEAAQVTSRQVMQDDQLDDLERKYALLADESILRQVRANTVPMKRPVAGRNWQASGYGYRKDPFTGRRAFHAGVDYAARTGTPVVAAASGIVTFSGRLGNYGNAVQIDHGDNISTLYGHLHNIYVSQWQYVQRDQTIATIGSTGRSTGPHLHYEVRINNRPRPVFKTIRELNNQRFL